MAEEGLAEGVSPSPAGESDLKLDGHGDHSVATSNPSLAFWRWLRAFGPFAFILLLDPFGCAHEARIYSENLILRIASPFHGGAAGPDTINQKPDTIGQEKVLVVRIDQRSLDAINTNPLSRRATWPISRSDQIQFILRPILDKKPRAIFLDYTFNADALQGEVEPTPTAVAPSRVAASPGGRSRCEPPDGSIHCEIEGAMANSGARLFLGSKPALEAVTHEGGHDCKSLRLKPNALEDANDVATDLRHWDRRTGVELVTLRNYDPVHYPLVPMALGKDAESQDCADEGEDVEGYLASPAYALFNVYCQELTAEALANPMCRTLIAHPERPVAAQDPQSGGEPSYYLYPRPMSEAPGPTGLVPYWPAFRTQWQRGFDQQLTSQGRPNVEQKAFIDQLRACDRPQKGPLRRLRLSWDLFKTSIVPAKYQEPCRYGVDTISLDQLVAAPIKPGRYVLVGLDLLDTPDPVANPLYREPPGVLLHAVALENLITRGAHYVHDTGPLIGRLDEADFWTLVLGLLLSLPAIFHRRLHAWAQRMAGLGPGSPAGVLVLSLPLIGILTLLWWPLGVSAGLLLWLTSRNMHDNVGRFGPLVVLLATLLVLLLPLVLAIALFFYPGWSMIDWLVLAAALSWAPELAFEVLDGSCRGEAAKEPASGALRSPWLRNFGAPFLVVVSLAFLVGILMSR